MCPLTIECHCVAVAHCFTSCLDSCVPVCRQSIASFRAFSCTSPGKQPSSTRAHSLGVALLFRRCVTVSGLLYCLTHAHKHARAHTHTHTHMQDLPSFLVSCTHTQHTHTHTHTQVEPTYDEEEAALVTAPWMLCWTGFYSKREHIL